MQMILVWLSAMLTSGFCGDNMGEAIQILWLKDGEIDSLFETGSPYTKSGKFNAFVQDAITKGLLKGFSVKLELIEDEREKNES